MNDQRETKVINLPFSKKEVVIYSYIKAKEVMALSDVEPKQAQRILIEELVISVGGETENVYDKVVDLNYTDYKVINDELMSMVKGNEEKKTELKPITTTSAAEEHSPATA